MLHKMRMKLLAQLAGQEINIKENAGFGMLSELAFPRAISTMNSTTSRIQSSEPQSPRLMQKQPCGSCRCLKTRRWNESYTLSRTLLNNSRDKTRCPHFMAPGQGPPQQSYLKQVVLLEAIIANNNYSSKIKETRRIRKLQVTIDPGVANHRQTKLLGLSQIATTTTVGTTGRK